MDTKSRLQTKNTTTKPTFSLSQPGLLQRTCECGGVPGLKGKCEQCSSKQLSQQQVTNPPATSAAEQQLDPSALMSRQQLPDYSFSRLRLQPKRLPVVQMKLAIGQPNDRYEQEADRVAEQVMRMPEPKNQGLWAELQRQAMGEEERLQTKPLAESITPLVQRETELTEEDQKKKEEETLQTKTASGQPLPVSYSLRVMRNGDGTTSGSVPVAQEIEQRIQQERSSGDSLSETIRAPMEQAFGVDFSSVKIHKNDTADQLNRSLNARAFTTGQDIFFRKGEYDPASQRGRGLLAHELTHVVQQGGAKLQRKPKLAQSEPSAVLRHLQTMQQQPGFDASLYRKEITEFQQTHSTEQIMAKQEQILRKPEGVNVHQRDNSQTLRRCGGGGGGGSKNATPLTPPVLSKKTISGPTPSNCGGFEWIIDWGLDKPSPAGGWIVQKVEIDQDIKDCKDKPVINPPGLQPSWYPLWEAWEVEKGQKVTTSAKEGYTYDDAYGSGNVGDNTKGSRTVKGTANFYEGLKLPNSFKVTNKAPAWTLPSTTSDPGLTGGSGSISHNLKATWDCCGSDKSTKLTPT